MAICLIRANTLDATALPPADSLDLVMGSKALESGSPADLVIVNLDRPSAVPVHDIDSALALSTHGSHVETVIVGGDILMRDREILVLDEKALLDECRSAAGLLRTRAGVV